MSAKKPHESEDSVQCPVGHIWKFKGNLPENSMEIEGGLYETRCPKCRRVTIFKTEARTYITMWFISEPTIERDK